MRIGVLADNHRLIDPGLEPLFRGVDEIWHAGDLVTPDILDVLRSWAPVRAVRGNNDVSSVLKKLPEDDAFEREGVRVLLRHIVGRPGPLDAGARRSILQFQPNLVVMGHSHRVLAESAGGRLYLNPGSCGPRRFSLPRSAAVLKLAADSLQFTVTDLDSGHVLLDCSHDTKDFRAAAEPASTAQSELFPRR